MSLAGSWPPVPSEPGTALLASLVRRCAPGCFAAVMATGIVSAVFRLAGYRALATVLLTAAGAGFAVLSAASAARVAVFPAAVRADLSDPARAFTAFAFVAAANVTGAGLGLAGHPVATLGLAVIALAAWLALAWLVPGRLAARAIASRRQVHLRGTPAAPPDPATRLHLSSAESPGPVARPGPGSAASFALGSLNGTVYLVTVGLQSLAIAAAVCAAARPGLRAGAWAAAVALWAAGVVAYLVTSALITARLRRAGLPAADPTASYWVAMGAASITVLAAAELLAVPGAPGAARGPVTGLAVACWALATVLIVPLAARSGWRHLRCRVPLRYRPDLWMVVFPAGMYAAASIRLGQQAGFGLVHRIGLAAAWPALAAWVLVIAGLIAAAARAPRLRR